MSQTLQRPLYWIGVLRGCNVCGGEFDGTMYDAKTHTGQWGNLCGGCFESHAGSLGLGLGQKYVQQSDGKYMCVEGR
jgi:hypothetical protein